MADNLGWEETYDKRMSNLVRECMLILEGLVPNKEQRDPIRQLMRRTIYNVTDGLKDELVSMGLERKQETFKYPR
ncbi:hypothetical protein CMI37_00455 [Candidatus Pacearchaeota archaeon]|nr:hypothetical protein [Candidatus Pacearchaeota archaeon]|tara:strand:- start:912 stop:1136 length:225 start_codon:yes stop_codon:yes gene_type:complete